MSAHDDKQDYGSVSQPQPHEKELTVTPGRDKQSDAKDLQQLTSHNDKSAPIAPIRHVASPNYHHHRVSQNLSTRLNPSWYYGYTNTVPSSPIHSGSSPFPPVMLSTAGFQNSYQYSPSHIFGSPGTTWSEPLELNRVTFVDDNFNLSPGASLSNNQNDLGETHSLNMPSEAVLYFGGNSDLSGYGPIYASLQDKSSTQAPPWKSR